MMRGPFLNNWGWIAGANTLPFGGFWWPLFILIVIAEIVLKGVSLYRSARNGQKYWFIALLIINTLGILPLIYLIWFADRKAKAPAKPQPAPSRSRRGRRKK